MTFTEKEIEILSRYISNPTESVFVVNLLGHITGALFARYSRAETGLRETLLREFLDEEGNLKVKHADELIERILISFGDDSVGEQENVHLSLEQISNLATKKIEDKRIGGSPIEQSTRYVFYDQKNDRGLFKYLREKNIMGSRFAEEYISAMDFIFQTYVDIIEPMQEHFRKLKPIQLAEYAVKLGDTKKYKLSELNDERDIKSFKMTYKVDIRTKACDTIRILLPAATLTNLGINGNGQFYKHLLTALYSDPLPEMNNLAVRAHRELDKAIPKYVKRAKYSEYLAETESKMQLLTRNLLKNVEPEKEENVVLLLSHPEDYRDNLTAQMLYQYSQHPLRQLRRFVKELNGEKKLEIIFTYNGDRKNRRDRPGRALEACYPFTFDLIGDFGIYRDLHRERMKTQQRQNLTTRLGRVISSEIEEIGWLERVQRCFELSESLYEKLLPEYTQEAQYVVLNGHKVRWDQGENLREAMHELELRTIPQGHFSYRRIAREMHRKIKEFDSVIADMMKFVDYSDYPWARADSEAKQRREERKLDLRY